jgi:integrase
MEGEQTIDTTKKARRERGTGRLWQIGDVWYIQYYVNGRQVRKSSGSTSETFAKKLLQKRLGEAAAGIHRELRRLTYEDLRRGFFNDYQTRKRKSLRRSMETGKPRLDAVTRLDGFFAGYRASAIDTDAMLEFTKKLQAEAKADSTINRSLAALRRMFHLAKESKKLRELPHFPMLKEPPPRKGVLDHEKYPLLLAALPEYMKPVLAIGYHTGMRLGEIQRLKWDQIDFLNRLIRLHAGETKNGEAREIPIDDELYAMLEACHLKRPAGFPFVCSRDGRPIGDFRRVWYDRCSKLGLGHLEEQGRRRGKYRGLIFHDLRRTFITDAEHAGAPRHEVMKGTGHKTESVYKRYAITNPEGQKSAMDKIVAFRKGAKTGQIEVPQAVAEVPEAHLMNLQ